MSIHLTVVNISIQLIFQSGPKCWKTDITVSFLRTELMQPADDTQEVGWHSSSSVYHCFHLLFCQWFTVDLINIVNIVTFMWLDVCSAHFVLVGSTKQHDICGLPVEVLHFSCILVWAIGLTPQIYSSLPSWGFCALPAPKTEWGRCWRRDACFYQILLSHFHVFIVPPAHFWTSLHVSKCVFHFWYIKCQKQDTKKLYFFKKEIGPLLFY